MDVFTILQLSRSVSLRRKRFSGENKEKKQQHYKKYKQIIYFNIINLPEYWCEISCGLKGSVINQNWSTQFLVAKFSQIALFDSWIICYGVWKDPSNVNVSISWIFKNGQF